MSHPHAAAQGTGQAGTQAIRPASSQSTDVLILGAGPAGCTAALNLARACRVLLVERDAIPRPRAGESLPPAANQLLRDMGLLDDFRQQGHLPCFGNRSQWGSPDWQESDFLRDPQGHGWHLDRPRFESWLRQHAQARGATLLAPARLEHIERTQQGWQVQVRTNASANVNAKIDNDSSPLIPIHARIVLDAGGRTPVVAKAQGAVRQQHDKLVCGWLLIKEHPPAHVPADMLSDQGTSGGLTRILATEHGWWYNAPLPHQQRILAFYSDSDLPPASALRDARSLLQLASETVPAWLAELPPSSLRCGPGQLVHGYSAANSASTQPAAGNGWLCAGDAALSFDPLSSQGIFNALYTGLAAAESIYRHLRGDIADFSQYSAQLQRIDAAYHQHLSQWYGSETRWPDAPFWQRRR